MVARTQGGAATGSSATGGATGTANGPGRATTGSSLSTGNGSTGGAGGASTGAATEGAGGGSAGDGATGSSGPLPCAAPSDAPGVTDTEITLGSVSSLSGPVPGLGTAALEAARAYVAYRNATGGVCGRQLALRTADDGTDNGRHRAIVTEFSSRVLGLVGGLGGGDAGSADVVEAAAAAGGRHGHLRGVPERRHGVRHQPPVRRRQRRSSGSSSTSTTQGVRTASIVYLGRRPDPVGDPRQAEAADDRRWHPGGQRAGASTQHAELRLGGARRGQQRGRLPAVPRRRHGQRGDGAVDGRHRLPA